MELWASTGTVSAGESFQGKVIFGNASDKDRILDAFFGGAAVTNSGVVSYDQIRMWDAVRDTAGISSQLHSRVTGSEGGLLVAADFDYDGYSFVDQALQGSVVFLDGMLVPAPEVNVAKKPPSIFEQNPGYIDDSMDNRYNPNLYHYPTNSSAIFPVNRGELEVWWSQKNIQTGMPDAPMWPMVLNVFNAQWPSDAEEIVVASGLGAEVFPPDFSEPTLYYQNDRFEPGFNPNEEHALLLGGIPYALRNDLNKPSSSEPYVLLEYVVPDTGKTNMTTWKVVLTNATHQLERDVEVGDVNTTANAVGDIAYAGANGKFRWSSVA